MEKEKKEKIGLFRYGVIAPVLNEGISKQNAYFRELSAKELEVPFTGGKRFNISTFKSWLRNYRKEGFDGLITKDRTDKGKTKKITDKISEGIKKVIEEYQSKTYSEVYRKLVNLGYFKKEELGRQAIVNYLKANNISLKKSEKLARKKFEMENINDLWIADFTHGFYVRDGKLKRKAYLCAIIDDRSRVITGYDVSLHENALSLENAFRDAINTYGICKRFYCDNGAAFRESHLQLVCARLGISLIHSKPYDSPSRGKIERFFRTVKDKFRPNLTLDITLEELDLAFHLWLQDDYHNTFHHGIETSPMERYMNEIGKVEIKRIAKENLDMYLLRTIKRKVKNDATVSVNAILYETPTKYIGAIVELRYPGSDGTNLYIYEDDKPVIKLNKVNVHENANAPHVSTSYSELMKENKDV